MAESRYGRLFTEADVERIVAGVLRRNGCNPETARHDAARVLAEDQRTTFPADEPLFLLRGSWVAAAAVVLEFERVAVSHGWDPAVAAAANALGFEIARWQTEHPDRVKVPD